MTQFTVIYDANVLYPFNMRDLLIQLAQPELDLVRARWTEEILDEAFRNLLANNPQLKTAQLSRTRELMCQSVPDCLVEGYESLIADLELPDPNDRHVLAAAIRANAEVIVTLNLKDFPSENLQRFDLEAQDPDAFLLNLISLPHRAPNRVLKALQSIVRRRHRPPLTLEEFMDICSRNGFPNSMKRLRESIN